MNWQPIETAPTDGTEFIGYSAGLRAYEGQWTAYVCRRQNNLWIAVGEGVANPTHWMPLPEAPAFG